MQQDPRALGHGRRQEQVEVAVARGEREAPQRVRQRDSAGAVVVVAGTAVAGGGRVHLRAAGVEHHVRQARARLLAEVHARLPQVQRVRAPPEALLGHARVAVLIGVASAHGHDAVAVRVGEPVRRPAAIARGQVRERELPRPDGHDLRPPTHGVAVDAHAREVVVAPDRLQLVERRPDHVRVPERHVVDRALFLRDVRAGERRRRPQLAHRDAVEPVRPLRGLDPELDVRSLAREGLRLDGEPFERRRQVALHREREHRRQRERCDRDQRHASSARVQAHSRADEREDGEDAERRQADMHVAVGGAGHLRVVRLRERELLQPESPCEDDEQRRREREQVGTCRAARGRPLARPERARDRVRGRRRNRRSARSSRAASERPPGTAAARTRRSRRRGGRADPAFRSRCGASRAGASARGHRGATRAPTRRTRRPRPGGAAGGSAIPARRRPGRPSARRSARRPRS